MIAYTTIIKDPKQLSLFEQILETYQDDMFRKAYRILRDGIDWEGKGWNGVYPADLGP